MCILPADTYFAHYKDDYGVYYASKFRKIIVQDPATKTKFEQKGGLFVPFKITRFNKVGVFFEDEAVNRAPWWLPFLSTRHRQPHWDLSSDISIDKQGT